MEPLYRPEGVEQRWQETWEAEGLYAARADDDRPTYVDAPPPPNVTGELHMGHAMGLTLADALVRWKRMQGYNCLFQPGYDHAGIATQYQVEKALEAEGRTRQEVGREAFVELVYIRYPLADGGGHVTIATVRPATILGDVAVAVHPDDERYRDLIGREAIVPFVERRVPVI